jgi:hypothetical protein
MRRLITLISAGRNRIIVIRRELPLTEAAGWVQAPYRTKLRRVLGCVRPRPVSVAVAAKSIIESPPAWQPQPAIPSSKEEVLQRRRVRSRPSEASRREALRGGGGALRREQRGWQAYSPGLSSWRMVIALFVPLCLHRPDKAEKFAADGCHDLRFVFSFRQQFLVASTQSPLRFPGNGFGFFIQTLLSLCQPAAKPRFMLVGSSPSTITRRRCALPVLVIPPR